MTDTADTESTETSPPTSRSTSQSASQSASQSSSSTLQSTFQPLSQRKTKIRKKNVFEFSELYLPIIVVIYLLLKFIVIF